MIFYKDDSGNVVSKIVKQEQTWIDSEGTFASAFEHALQKGESVGDAIKALGFKDRDSYAVIICEKGGQQGEEVGKPEIYLIKK